MNAFLLPGYEYIAEIIKNNTCPEATVFGLLDFRRNDGERHKKRCNYPMTGSGVLLGFVDTGIDYMKDIFMYRNKKSRIAGLYDQTVQGAAPYGFGIGTEYTQRQINLALASRDPFSVVPSRDTAGHGTFLASVAAGGEENGISGAAPDSELLVVKLRQASPGYRREFLIPPEQKNAFLSCDIMLGIEYIVRKAKELDRPAVICLGIGTSFGGHDGYSLFEQYLHDVSVLPGVCVCSAAGNESLAGHHYSGFFKKGETMKTVKLKVNQVSDVFMTLWSGTGDILSVSIKSPIGEISDCIVPRTATTYTVPLNGGTCLVQTTYDFPMRGSGAENINIKMRRAAPGIWSVNVHANKIINGQFNIWLPIIGLITPGVKFADPDKNNTIIIPGTCQSVITCGACSIDGRSIYPMSSLGPTRLNRLSPDIAAPGVDMPGMYPEGPGMMSGTGVSAALAAGECALLMQWGLLNDTVLNTYRIKTYLIQGASRSPNLIYPNNQWGYGVIDISNSLLIAESEAHPASPG